MDKYSTQHLKNYASNRGLAKSGTINELKKRINTYIQQHNLDYKDIDKMYGDGYEDLIVSELRKIIHDTHKLSKSDALFILRKDKHSQPSKSTNPPPKKKSYTKTNILQLQLFAKNRGITFSGLSFDELESKIKKYIKKYNLDFDTEITKIYSDGFEKQSVSILREMSGKSASKEDMLYIIRTKRKSHDDKQPHSSDIPKKRKLPSAFNDYTLTYAGSNNDKVISKILKNRGMINRKHDKVDDKIRKLKEHDKKYNLVESLDLYDDNYEIWTIENLKINMKARKITVPSGSTKSDLLQLFRQHVSKKPDSPTVPKDVPKEPTPVPKSKSIFKEPPIQKRKHRKEFEEDCGTYIHKIMQLIHWN